MKSLGLFQQLRITPGSMGRTMFEELPFPIDHKLYIFNITNPDEVMAGEKPKLEEFGPYHFE